MSVEALVETVHALDVPVDGDAIAAVLRAADELAAKASIALAEFDNLPLWDCDGATSLVAWLRDRGDMTSRDAALASRTATRLRACPATRLAWLDGRLSGGQVQAILGNITVKTAALYAEHERELIAELAPLSVGETAQLMQSWQAHAEAVVDDEAPAEPRRVLRLSRLLDGRAELRGSLDAEAVAVVETALRLATTDDATDDATAPGDGDGDDGARSASERRGDALVDVCRWFLDHQHEHSDGRNRPHVNVVVDLDRLAAGGGGQGRLIDGTPLDQPTIRRILCDAGIHRVVTAGGSTVLDYGRRTRVVSPDLWAALVVRDRHCRAPGCDRPPGYCEAHHVVWWTDGGVTAPENLALLCSRHHHRFHQPGWHVKLRPDATLEVTSPTGRTRTTSPPAGR